MRKRKDGAVGHVAGPHSCPILSGAVCSVLLLVEGKFVDRQVVEISLQAAGSLESAVFRMLLDVLGFRVDMALDYTLRIPRVVVGFVDFAGVVPFADIAEAVGHRNLHIRIRALGRGAEKVHRVGRSEILPLVFFVATIADILHDGAVVAGITLHFSLRHSVLAPFHLPLAVVVPDIGHYAVALFRVFAHTVGVELTVLRETHRLEIPFQVRAVHFVDIVAPWHSVRSDEGLPEEAAQRSVVVLHQIRGDFIVLSEMLVSGTDVRIVRLQNVVERLAVGDDVIEPLVLPAALDRLPAVGGDMREQDHQVSFWHVGQVALNPLKLMPVDIAYVVADIVEDVVHHDVMHATLVEGVVSRAEQIGVSLL